MNKLIAIGSIGNYDVYLNLTRQQAIDRWKLDNPGDTLPNVEEYEITDQFRAYCIWEPRG